jgi:hypothetical protein
MTAAKTVGQRATIGIPRALRAVVLSGLTLTTLSFTPPWSATGAPSHNKNAAQAAPAPDLPLDVLLERAAEYSRKLESAAFDFVCREEIRETIDPSLDVRSSALGSRITTDPGGITVLPRSYGGPTVTLSNARKIKRTYVYDYQCVRAGRAIREIRTLLEENGKRKNVPNAELATSVVVFANALLGPVGLFADRFQPDYVYAIAGVEKVGQVRALVIDAKPRPGAPATRNLYGKAWVDASTGDILRIEWSENRVGRFDVFDRRAQLFERTPRLVIRSEFEAEKNGLRFPTRFAVEEAYLKKSGRAFVRSKTEVVYKDFKFFSVEYDIRD